MTNRQNILIIVSDQLAQRAVGAYGNKNVNTAAIDGLARSGVRFANAYTPYPLCCPARASFWTGLLPHQTGVLSNGREYPIRPISEDTPTLGSIFRDAGYETVHFGKCHDAGSLRGFDCAPEEELPVQGSDCWPVNYDTRRDANTVKRSVAYLEQDHEKPFIMIADIQNPHDICNWVGAFQGEHEDLPIPGDLPPTLSNLDVDDLETRPIPIRHICCAHNRQSQAAAWNETNFRHYLAAYYHYIERADRDIQTILDALKKTAAVDNTLIVFFADHGDSMGAHRLVTKHTSFYEETTRVPFIVTGPGISGENIEHPPLVSLCDLVPTLCDYAGLATPQGLYGRSLMPWLKGETPSSMREHVVSEWVSEWGFTIEPGRMVRTDQFKYTRYLEGNGEELFDLNVDPGEMVNLAQKPEYQKELGRHRMILERHMEETKDDFNSLEIKADERWRRHATGYYHHEGPAAPNG